jgi:hypothetical protein
MLFSPNKTEKKRQKEDEKIAREKKKHEGNPDKDDWMKMKQASGDDSWVEGEASKPADEKFVPLKTLADVGPGTVMTYHGREQADGSVLATSVEFKRNEMEEGEFKLWKSIKIKEKTFNFESGKPGELKVGPAKIQSSSQPGRAGLRQSLGVEFGTGLSEATAGIESTKDSFSV